MPYALEVRDLRKTFRGKRLQKVVALDGVSFSVRRGEVFGFLGVNGAGKSTTIKILMGLLKPDSGDVHVLGNDVGDRSFLGRVGYLPENPSIYEFLTPRQFIEIAARIKGIPKGDVSKNVEYILRRVGLSHAVDRRVRTFSKGMVQRLALAHAILSDPDVFIFDEPMSGLDPVGRILVKDIICDLKRAGKSVFFSTHIVSDVENVCDRFALLHHGKINGIYAVNKVLEEGVLGYKVYIDKNKGDVKTIYVDKNDIDSVLINSRSCGHDILLIEPQRRNLEDMFRELL